ncbi:hypothetical protein [Actinospongicola halichondriae]|uniref:hypothetical protein n=1 Tax=Actinospongicola halichondriae TaxID=3236844 RepID=UPI003D4F3048
MAPRRGPLRLVVPSPDGTRVLARPNGLAGWALPQIAVDLPFGGWDDAGRAAAAAAIGTTIEPVESIGDGAWVVQAERVGAAGTTWISSAEVERLGTDATLAREWFTRQESDGGLGSDR